MKINAEIIRFQLNNVFDDKQLINNFTNVYLILELRKESH